jgi:transposase-like protein
MEARREMTKQENRSSAEGARRASGAEDRWPFDEPPDPEVPERPERRKFTAEYKIKILAEADACETHGEIGALLRREGLYSSHLSRWRQRQRAGALGALSPKKRGPEPDPVVPFKKRINDLERENERLSKKLTQAETIIDVQKKVSGLLGTAEKGDGED